MSTVKLNKTDIHLTNWLGESVQVEDNKS